MSTPPLNHDVIIEKNLDEEIKKKFLDYAMTVITSRALPDVRDGLKPVHRRILYSMFEQGFLSKGHFYKSARIVGNVLGKYHPHGDSSVYEALVRLAQPWVMMGSLVDGQGNFGSMDGDSAAAMRYTESKMTKLAEELMKNLNKKNVPFKDNYDGKDREPVVLPAKYPNLLINGISGIAVAMASNMPPHSLKEAINAQIEFNRNEEITVEELMEFLPGPDFPTGGQILGNEGIIQAYKTGRGKFVIRGTAQIEIINGVQSIVITQVPYGTNKAVLIEKIKDIHKMYEEFKKKLRANKKATTRSSIKKPPKALNFIRKDGINDDSDDKSTEDNIRIVIQLIDGIDPRVVINHLYKYTPLETSYSFNNTALVPTKDNKLKPRCLSLKQILKEFLSHQLFVLKNELNFDLDKNEKDFYFTSGLIKAIYDLDETIKIIRAAQTIDDAISGLVNHLGIDKEQAAFILEKKIRTLTGYQQLETEEHLAALIIEIKRLKDILSSEETLKNMINEDLERIRDEYGQERRTSLKPPAELLEEKDLIQNERVVITFSNNGNIKSTKESYYRTQRRNGRGVSGMNLDDDDFINNLEIMYKHDNLLIFTDKGKVYQLKGFDVPETQANTKGTHVYNLIPGIEDDENIRSVISVKVFSKDQYLFFTTKKGVVKKTSLSEYENIRKNGIIAITLEEKDALVNVNLTTGLDKIAMLTSSGQSIVFEEEDVRPSGRSTMGVRGIKVGTKDFVVSSDIFDDTGELFIITQNGYSKKTLFSEFKLQKRGGSGARALKVTDKTGPIVSSVVISEEDSIYILTMNGTLIKLESDNLSTYKRNAQGTKTINLRDDDIVKTVARVSEEEVEEETETFSK
jgi:DNA gyrase subunit A